MPDQKIQKLNSEKLEGPSFPSNGAPPTSSTRNLLVENSVENSVLSDP
jgi:hypothetical protein